MFYTEIDNSFLNVFVPLPHIPDFKFEVVSMNSIPKNRRKIQSSGADFSNFGFSGRKPIPAVNFQSSSVK